jgi:hypothetical protein
MAASAFQTTNINKDASRSTALKLYTGEVLKAFSVKNIGLDLVSIRTINSGKSAQWIVTGKASDSDVQTHTPGGEVLSNVLTNDEVTITVDTRYYYSHFVDELDEKLAQYEIRGEMAKQAGEALATKIDKAIFAGIYGMKTYVPKTGQVAATVVTVPNTATTAQAKGDELVAAYFECRAAMNEKDVTAEPTAVVGPEDYYNLVQSTRGVNADYTSGNGGIDAGKISLVAGMRTAWSNHLPTGPRGLVFTKDVYGVVKAMDITSESNYIPERLGHLLTSYYAMGMGPLNSTGLCIIENA